MKTLLMDRNHDFAQKSELPAAPTELEQDLDVAALLHTMAAGDAFLLDVARRALLESLTEPAAILYRQQILSDCLAQASTIRELYQQAVEAIERERKVWGAMLKDYPEGALYRSVEVLGIFVEIFGRLRNLAQNEGPKFKSEGFIRFFTMLRDELSDEYLATVHDQLEALALRTGVHMTAQLGVGGKGVHYLLQKPENTRRSWKFRFEALKDSMGLSDRNSYSYEIPDRDETGFRALSEIRAQGIAQIAAALANSTDHILGFFKTLRTELAFYIGCLNLYDRLAAKGEPITMPVVAPESSLVLTAQGLYDVALSLSMEGRATGNDLDANNKLLLMVTGANRGGKSTFLRSTGLAMLMMQAGMFVGATEFSADVRSGLFTHFKREEDVRMKSGKFDEELARMSRIVDQLDSRSMVFLNESFAATNEREGSEVARQILRALHERGIKIIYVTHMYDLAHGLFAEQDASNLFLRAERLADGSRTYRIRPGEPLRTSFGEDLYKKIFAQKAEATTASSL